jgi:hypothetical protein
MRIDGATSSDKLRPFISEEVLLRQVESSTQRRVQDLRIRRNGPRVEVTGRSRTYYAKQLVTQAILNSIPTIELDNEITVCSG